MKLYMKDGRLRFDYEFEQSNIFTDNDFDFTYLGKGIREYIPFHVGDKSCIYPYEEDWAVLGTCVRICRDKGVTITPEAQAYIDEFRAKAEADIERHEEDKARQKALLESAKAKQEWQRRCKNGCRGCAYLRYDTDMPWCKASHHILEEKNIADMKKADSYDNDGVFHILNFEPFPDDGCPFKTEPLTEEEKAAIGYDSKPKVNMESYDAYNKTFGILLRR